MTVFSGEDWFTPVCKYKLQNSIDTTVLKLYSYYQTAQSRRSAKHGSSMLLMSLPKLNSGSSGGLSFQSSTLTVSVTIEQVVAKWSTTGGM